MIYCIPPENYPKQGFFIEEFSYRDENDFEWKIARVENGFIVKYFGDDYFKDKYFSCELKNGSWVTINNTNCIFFKDESFDAFYEMRNILKNGYTDDIWETFEELFTERFEHSSDFLECERMTKNS